MGYPIKKNLKGRVICLFTYLYIYIYIYGTSGRVMRERVFRYLKNSLKGLPNKGGGIGFPTENQ